MLAKHLQEHLPDLSVFQGINIGLPRNRVRVPDIAVLVDREDVMFVESTPVLVVEILSPRTRSEDVFRKSTDYAAGGVGQYWLIDPNARAIDVLELVDGEWEPIDRLDEEHEHCVFPSCTIDATRCDLDHIAPYDPPGPPGQTSPGNLACLCRAHHRMKTFTAWDYQREPDGSYLWTSPHRQRWRVVPGHRTTRLDGAADDPAA